MLSRMQLGRILRYLASWLRAHCYWKGEGMEACLLGLPDPACPPCEAATQLEALAAEKEKSVEGATEPSEAACKQAGATLLMYGALHDDITAKQLRKALTAALHAAYAVDFGPQGGTDA